MSVLGMVKFIVPFWAMQGLEQPFAKLRLITGFEVLFYGRAALGMMARLCESLGAAAA